MWHPGQTPESTNNPYSQEFFILHSTAAKHSTCPIISKDSSVGDQFFCSWLVPSGNIWIQLLPTTQIKQWNKGPVSDQLVNPNLNKTQIDFWMCLSCIMLILLKGGI